jgi:dipeptidase E
MKFYLSSFKFGDKKALIKDMAPNDQILVIPNALDFRAADDEQTLNSIENKKMRLGEIGLHADTLDLKDYFSKKNELETKVRSVGAVFVMGGNVFVLRQAMKLSGLDEILISLKDNADFLYSGYSAAGCVLAPSLEPYKVVGDATITPYDGQDEIIWEGLGLVDFAFMPHYKSDHPETEAIDRGIQYCEEHNIKYKAVRDGEVLVF